MKLSYTLAMLAIAFAALTGCEKVSDEPVATATATTTAPAPVAAPAVEVSYDFTSTQWLDMSPETRADMERLGKTHAPSETDVSVQRHQALVAVRSEIIGHTLAGGDEAERRERYVNQGGALADQATSLEAQVEATKEQTKATNLLAEVHAARGIREDVYYSAVESYLAGDCKMISTRPTTDTAPKTEPAPATTWQQPASGNDVRMSGWNPQARHAPAASSGEDTVVHPQAPACERQPELARPTDQVSYHEPVMEMTGSQVVTWVVTDRYLNVRDVTSGAAGQIYARQYNLRRVGGTESRTVFVKDSGRTVTYRIVALNGAPTTEVVVLDPAMQAAISNYDNNHN